jgi:riboflavin kinase / FMN adenylyltransferase
MKTFHSAGEWERSDNGVSLAIGFFDGVHLGHQQVIRQAVSDARQQEARAIALTFDRHPKTIVAPDRVPPLIYSLPQKLRAIESLGPDAAWMIAFDENFSHQTGEAFIRSLVKTFGPIVSICVGADFAFGYKRSGNVEVLKKLGAELGFTVHGLAAVSLDGQAVSSTRIREAIRLGQLDFAGQMLGRSYALAGKIVTGDRIGRRLGFPTANLDVAGRAVPPNGVYAAHTLALGWSQRAVVNIGWRPTLRNPAPELRVEAHLLDFDGDLADQEMEIFFLDKLRDEQKFPSLEALQARIAKDVAAARHLFRTGIAQG